VLLDRKAHQHATHLVVRELGRMREMTRRPLRQYIGIQLQADKIDGIFVDGPRGDLGDGTPRSGRGR
jgi:hypothetical protein